MSENKFINEVKSNQVISGIYKIENLINHKIYIGQSVNIYARWRKHKSVAFNKNDKCYDFPLYRAIRKYGIENFSFEIIKETYDRNYWEIFLIQIYHATDDSFGYNTTLGGYHTNINGHPNWSKPHSEESKIKQRVMQNLLSLMYTKEKELNDYTYNDFQNLYKGKFSINDLSLFENYFDNFEELYSDLYKKIEYQIKNNITKHKKPELIYAKCVETKEIYPNSQWRKLGYNSVEKVIKGKICHCKGLHFVKATKEESDIFMKEHPNGKNIRYEKRENVIKDLVYAKCLETDDILPAKDWVKLGYCNIYNILLGKQDTLFNKHFIKISKDEYARYIKENSNKDDILERNKIKFRYVKCIETNEIHRDVEWYNMGYESIYNILRGKGKSCKGFHFIEVDENNNYIDKNYEDIIFNLLKMPRYDKRAFYVKCIETSEIHTISEWKNLGYNNVYLVIRGEQKRCGGKHFIKSTKEEYESYLKQLSIMST